MNAQRFRWLFLAIALTLLAVSLLSYPIFDLAVSDSVLGLQPSRLVQGLSAAARVIWYLGSRGEPAFSQPSGAPSLPGRSERVRHHARWFVAMRWIAVAVRQAPILIAVIIAEILPRTALLALVGWWLVLIGANIWFMRRLRWVQDLEKEIVLQATVDLLVPGWLNASGVSRTLSIRSISST